MEREFFLNQIKNSLQQTVLPEASPDHPGSFDRQAAKAGAPTDRLVEDFRQELEAVGGYFYAPADAVAVTATLMEILKRHRARRIMAWDEAYLGWPGLLAELSAAGVTVEAGFLPADRNGRTERLARLNEVTVGLTGVEAGLADTGTIVLLSGPGRGRLASLLPRVHIVLLPGERLYPSLPAFLAARPTATTESSNLVFITGPSRSGDIEMTLNIGVHGPGEIHILLLPAG